MSRLAYQRRWRARNPDKIAIYNQRHQEWWAKLSPQTRKRKQKDAGLKKLYGITLTDCNELKRKQHGRCAICPTKLGQRYHVDHDHKTKKVRALLCPPCNLTIGHAQEDINRLRGVIQYLRRHHASTT